MFDKFNRWFKTPAGQRIMTFFPLIMIVSAILGYWSFSRSTNTSQPRQVLLSLNEAVFPQNSQINTLTYNSLNSKVLIANVIKTKAQEDAVLEECKINYNFMTSPDKKTPEEIRMMTLRNLTCLHYKGALLQDNYWALQDLPAFKLSQLEIASLVEPKDSIRATVIRNYDLSEFTLVNLRNPEFYRGLSANSLQNLSIFCRIYYKEKPENSYFTPDYEFNSAKDIVASEACALASFFYSENSRIK